jgi:hypothetical protein
MSTAVMRVVLSRAATALALVLAVALFGLPGSGNASPAKDDAGVFTRWPNEAQLYALYPPAELRAGRSGTATVDCFIAPHMATLNCQTLEGETESDFVTSARQAGTLYAVKPTEDGRWRGLRMIFHWTAPGRSELGPHGELAWCVRGLLVDVPAPLLAPVSRQGAGPGPRDR